MSSVKMLLDTLDALDIEVVISNGKLSCFGPPDSLTDSLQSEISQLEFQIIQFLEKGKLTKKDCVFHSVGEFQNRPASYNQQRVWCTDALLLEVQNYHIPFGFELHGDIDRTALENTLKLIIERHQILRSRVFMVGEDLVQQVMPEFDTPFEYSDCSCLNGEMQVILDEAISPFLNIPFNLNGDVLLRLKVIRISEQTHYLIFNTHHIAFDDWSMDILLTEFNRLYIALIQGLGNPLPPLPLQYQDFAFSQRQHTRSPKFERQLNYWLTQLHGLPQLHNIKSDNRRKSVQQFSGASELLELDLIKRHKLEALCQLNGVTMFMLMETAIIALFSTISKECDMVIGTPTAGRLTKETESLIGYFSNTLVLRTQVEQQESFSNLLQRNKLIILDAFEFQAVPFDILVGKLQPNRSLSHAPLVQLFFTFLEEKQPNYSPTKRLNSLANQHISTQKSVKFDLEIYITKSKEQLRIRFDYDTDLYTKKKIKCLMQAYAKLLDGIVANSQLTIAQLTKIDLINELASPSVPIRVNGYPVETTDIEQVLYACPLVRECHIAIESGENEKRSIIAYVELCVGNPKEWTSDSIRSIRNYLKSQLPDYLVPHQIKPLHRTGVSGTEKESNNQCDNDTTDTKYVQVII